ncbi:MAG TPA: hypothetical protein VIC29_09330 [Steroidobacteraceae bacterium]|jgi:uncharacterized protein (DUF983 family)
MNANGTQTPQFATAEYAANIPAGNCATCKKPISGAYFKIKGAPICAACTERIRAQIPRDSHGAFVRALVFGIGGASIGFALYVAFALATGLIIGYVSLAVGYIVGKAMHVGSRGIGGRRYQVAAVLLTYFAVSLSAVPIAIDQSRAHHTQEQSAAAAMQPVAPVNVGKAIAMLALVGIASPILDLQDPVHGLIGLVILFAGLRFAWQFTAARTVNISGPYTAASAGAT